MRENEVEHRRWFLVDAKSFTIVVEGSGSLTRFIVTERRKGLVSWIRFWKEGMKNLLRGVEDCSRFKTPSGRCLEWKEKGSFIRKVQIKQRGRFISIFVLDSEGGRHFICIPEGKGLVNGWSLMVEKLRNLGIGKPEPERKVLFGEPNPTKEKEVQGRLAEVGVPFVETLKRRGTV